MGVILKAGGLKAHFFLADVALRLNATYLKEVWVDEATGEVRLGILISYPSLFKRLICHPTLSTPSYTPRPRQF